MTEILATTPPTIQGSDVAYSNTIAATPSSPGSRHARAVHAIRFIILFLILTITAVILTPSTAHAVLSSANGTIYSSIIDRYPNQQTSYQYIMDGSGNTLTFYESLTLDDETYTENNFSYSISNYIYLDTNIIFDLDNVATQYSGGAVSNDDAQIIVTFYDSRLGLYDTELCDSVDANGEYTYYAVQDRTTDWSKYSSGEIREYGTPLSGTPAYTVTIKNAGYTSTGETIDFVLTCQYEYMVRRGTLVDTNDVYPCLIHFYVGEPIFELFTLEAMQEQVACEINMTFYYSSGDNAGDVVDDAEYVFQAADLDVSSNRDWNNQYSEAVWFIDGFDNPIELTKYPTSLLEPALKSYSNSGKAGSTSYTNLVRVTQSDASQTQATEDGLDFTKSNETIVTGFMTEISSGSFTFLWTGHGCGTKIALSAGGYGVPSIPDPVKEVSNTEAKLGDTITYTVTETIPYTYGDNTNNNRFTSIVFTDTLDAAFDISSTTVTIYRTDTLSGSTRVNDTSNWIITKIGYTITATCRDSTSAGGNYEFVITTKVSSDADLSGYTTTTSSSGVTAYIISNTATVTIDAKSFYTPPVTILVKEANVEYKLVSTMNPSDSTLPPGVETYAGASYTIEDGLTTSDTSAVWYFNGWYYDSSLTQPASGTITLPEGTTILYGQWLVSEITLEKTADDTLPDNVVAGDTIDYTFKITNSGGTTLTNITLYDSKIGGYITVTNNTLEPGEYTIARASYTLTQGDIDSGSVYNTATTTGEDPGGSSVTDNDDETTTIPQSPGINLVKTADVSIVDNAVAGTSTITYMFTVTNTGNVSLCNITLTDPLLGGEIELEKTVLVPNAQTFGWATYTVTQDDIDAGVVTNTATVTGDDPGGSSVTDNDGVDVDVEQLPSIDLVKEVVGDVVIEDAYAGDWVQFAVTVTNTGNTTLSNVTITDLLEGATFVVEELNGVTFNDDSVVIDTMLPDDTVTVYVDYQLTQADVDRGDTENIATVTADPPGDLTTICDDDDARIETPSVPDISLTKTVATANGVADEDLTTGDELVYTLIITNTGNTTLSNIVLYDELLGGDIDLTNAVRGTVDITAADAINDDTDVATVGGMVTDDVEGTDEAADAGVSTLSSDVDTDVATDEVDNTNTALADDENDDTLIVEDESIAETGEAEDDQTITLSPGEYLLVEVTYTITQDDMNTGRVDNTASVTAEDPNGNGMSDEDTAVTYLPQHPEITLVKEGSFNSLTAASVGDVINYTLTVVNSGDVSLTNLTLTDELEGIVIDTSALDGLTLTPGETVVVTAEYTLTDADLEAGNVYNHATVTAESIVPYDEDNIWSGAQQVSDDDDALVDGIIAVADDLILAQTGEKILIISGCVLVGLIATASAAAGYIGKQRRFKQK